MQKLTDGPGYIFDILKKHFSDAVYSAVALADFYASPPLKGESPSDSCIMLNKEINVAEDSLKRQLKKLNNPSHEVMVMFVRHCPNSALSSIAVDIQM